MKLLDLYCGAGGAAMGYHRAGFDDITGVDIKPQPRYPFGFVQADALEYLAEHGHEYDAIHASPPCQAYTLAGKQWRANGTTYTDLIVPTRDGLIANGCPWVIENVPGAPLHVTTILNGALFGLPLRRTRWFETSFAIPLVLRPREVPSGFRMGRPVEDGGIITPVGHFSNVPYARKVMGIDWMTQGELAQAIPPAYTEFIGSYLMAEVLNQKALP